MSFPVPASPPATVTRHRPPLPSRRLKYLNLSLEQAPFIMHACCVLHNFIQIHDSESNSSVPLDQRDGMHEPLDLRAAGRVRVTERARRARQARSRGFNIPSGLDAAPVGTAPVPNPAGNLAAGKAMRDELKEYCWQLHVHRRESRAAQFAIAHAAMLAHEDDGDPSEDPDAAWY